MITLTIEEILEDATLEVEDVIDGGSSPPYEGSYEVKPEIGEQVLPTKNLRMTDDLKVLAIPYSEVTNPEGGFTVNIAF